MPKKKQKKRISRKKFSQRHPKTTDEEAKHIVSALMSGLCYEEYQNLKNGKIFPE